MVRHTTPIVIPSLSSNSATKDITLGTKVSLSDGGEAVYVQAASEIARYSAVAIGVDYTVVNLTTSTAADGTGISKAVGAAQTSIASGNYGWVQTSGRPIINLASACADRVTLYTTGTAGVLDDATVSAALIAGVVSKTTISNATAVTCIAPTGMFVHPHANPA